MVSQLKNKLQPLLTYISQPFLALPPNLISIIGLSFSGLFLLFLVKGKTFLALISLLGIGFDAIDGAVARKTGRQTKFGGLLDSSLDRIGDGIIISAFGFAGLVNWSIVICLLICSFLISYIRSRAELAGKAKFKLDVGWAQRSERIMLLGTSALVYLLFPQAKIAGINLTEITFMVLIFLSLITIYQRTKAASDKLKN